MEKTDNLREIAIATQKIHFKNGKDSLCKNCIKYEEDCAAIDKICGTDKSPLSNYSTVTRCSGYKEKEATCKQ